MSIRGLLPTALTDEEWAGLLAALSLRGKAWKDPDSRMWAFWRGLAPEFGRVHARILALVEDLNPNTMSAAWATLWEGILGLPEADLPVPATLAERRATIIARLNKSVWSQTKPAYVALAALLGLTVTIDLPGTQPRRWRVTCPEAITVARVGTAVVGDRLEEYSDAGAKLYRVYHRRRRLASRIMFRD